MQLLTNFIESKEGLTMIRSQSLTSNGCLNSYFIIDTGTSTSLFSPEVGKVKNTHDYIIDLDDNTLLSEKCTAVLSLADKTMNIEGNVVNYDMLPNIDGKHISGILGADFFMKNHLVLDYCQRGIYSKGLWETGISKYPFIPMKLGTNEYFVPTILLNCDNRQLPFVVDTGATNNMITSTICYDRKEIKNVEPCIVKGLASSLLAKECEMVAKIQLSYKGELIEHEFLDTFTVIEQGSAIRKSSIFNSVCGLIGNALIRRKKWTIDFDERKIFKKLE